MNHLLSILTIFLFSFNILFSQVINVPGDKPTIQNAIDSSVDGDTVLVEDGLYYENINFKGRAITVASWFIIDGDETHIDRTIINGSQPSNPNSGSVVVFLSGEDITSVLTGFTVTQGSGGIGGGHRSGGGIAVVNSGAKITHNKIIENYVTYSASVGGGIFIYSPVKKCFILNNIIAFNEERSTSLTGGGGGIHVGEDRFRNVIIMNNYIAHNKSSSANIEGRGAGGGIDLNQSCSIIKNNVIVFNESYQGGGLDIWDGNQLNGAIIENNTIAYNHATSEFGGGILDGSDGEQNPIRNCILWGNKARDNLNQISKNAQGSDIVLEYSLVQGGYAGTGNIDQNPIFQDTVNFYLDTLSPCIDAGNLNAVYNDVEDSNNIGFGLFPALGVLRNDMGSFGGPNSEWFQLDIISEVKIQNNILPQFLYLYQNYPNPFNPSTKISYSITEQSIVTLKVFDVLGREVETLFNKEQPEGNYEVEFYASKLTSGIYFYRIQTGDFVETKKMILMK